MKKYSEYLQAKFDIEKVALNEEQLKTDIEQMLKTLEDTALINNTKVHNDYAALADSLAKIKKHKNEFYKNLEINLDKTRKDLFKKAEAKQKWDSITEDEYFSHRKQYKTMDYVLDELSGILGQYISWNYPILYYEPNTGDLTKLLLAGEPFYVVDQFEETVNYINRQIPTESHRRVQYYPNLELNKRIPDGSLGFVVTWKNFVFKTLGEIRHDIEMLSRKLMPGGYMLLDFNDAETVEGATSCEKGLYGFHWQNRISRFLENNDLEIVNVYRLTHDGASAILAKKKGQAPKTTLVGKYGIILANQEFKKEKLKREAELRQHYLLLIESLKENNNREFEKMKAGDDLNKIVSKLDNKKILEKKRDKALKKYEEHLTRYGKRHTITLSTMLQLSKIFWALENYKDAQRQLNVIMKFINDEVDSELQRNVNDWYKIINNID